MQQQVTNEQIQQRFETLSEDMKSIITSPEVAQGIENIGRRHKLRIDKIGELVDETGLVMLGFTKTRDFVDNLTRRTEISKEQAETVAVEIDNEVFSRMRNSLQQIQYKSTSDQRFEESGDYGDNPVRDSMIADIEKNSQTQQSADSDLNGSMSSTDYNPEGFTQQTSSTSAPQAYPAASELSQEPLVSSPSPTPKPQVSDAVTKDFKKILEEKISTADSHVNADPYKESIE